MKNSLVHVTGLPPGVSKTDCHCRHFQEAKMAEIVNLNK